MTGKDLVRLLQRHIRGSHHILRKDAKTLPVPVHVHGGKDLGKGLLARLLKEAGLK